MNRPIVNEYLEILWKYISDLSPDLERKARTHKINLSHDVDRPKFTKPTDESPSIPGCDIFAHYRKLLDFANKHNLSSVFYFLSAVTEPELDANYTLHDEEIEKLQKKVAEKYGYDLVDHKLELYGVKKK